MHDWLLRTRVAVANGGGTAKAIDYSLKRWVALSRYVDDGSLPIDNNPVENTIRPIAVGKKNWLFTGSERAGKRAAAIQSLLATAKLNGLDPSAWLRQTLEALPTVGAGANVLKFSRPEIADGFMASGVIRNGNCGGELMGFQIST